MLTRALLLKNKIQECPEETIEEVVNEVEEPVTNPEVIEPTEESAVTEQPEPDIFNKKRSQHLA